MSENSVDMIQFKADLIRDFLVNESGEMREFIENTRVDDPEMAWRLEGIVERAKNRHKGDKDGVACE